MKELLLSVILLITLYALVTIGLEIIAYILLMLLVLILAGVAIFHVYRIGYCTDYPDDED